MSAASFEMLHLLCRPSLPTDAEIRRDAIAGAVDWRHVTVRLLHYGGAMWAWQHIQSLGLDVPTQQAERIARAARTEVGRALLTDQVRNQLAPLLTGERPEALILKGRAIEERAYPDGLFRPSNDLDLLVRPGRRGYVEQWLRDRDYAPVAVGRDEQLWHGPDRSGAVDIHDAPLRIARFSGLSAVRVSALFDDTVALHSGGSTLADDAHTALLLGHLHAGVFTDLRHLADVAQWLNTVQVSPTEVRSVLRQWGGRRCFDAAMTALLAWDSEVLPKPWRQFGSAPALSDWPWRWVVERAAAGSRAGEIQPPGWLRRGGLLTHLDSPLGFVRHRLQR
ncbi:MAG: nucleotidyltransferase family protein [Myxococcales bacterium]|nr:nucleotidyltransferase family protein [Myxococcales bacterium]